MAQYGEPSEDAINEFVMIAGLQRETAVKWLKPGIFHNGAPSRPPSRVSNRGASSGVSSGLSSATVESEEEQVNRAMAMSMSQSQTPPPGQETGTVMSSWDDKPVYGPANRDYYEPSEWAMTTYAGTQEILLNPEPEERIRQKNTPAFFKPSGSGHRLPALLKILHAIPMAREALLNRTHTLPDYGCDKDWWDGTPIKVLRIVNMDSEGRQVDGDDIIYESQRLMAFLDETDRAYGSTDVLAGADCIKEFNDDKVYKFLRVWETATSRTLADSSLAHMFESVGIKIDRAWDSTRREHFCSLDVNIDSDMANKGLTLYEALDELLWSDQSGTEEVYLEKLGDVVTMEITNRAQSERGLGIEIPAIWYPDRYLESSIQEAKIMRDRKSAISNALHDKEASHSWMTGSQKANGTSYLAMAADFLEQEAENKRQGVKDRWTELINRADPLHEDSSDEEEQDPSELESAAKELRMIADKVSQNVQAVEQIREDTRQQLKEISQLYTKPSNNSNEPPHHRYTLRGVSIGAIANNSHKLYVLEPTKPEEGSDMLSTEAKDWQWWKLDFLTGDMKPVVHEKVTEDEVLKTASTEASSALLVYASDRAVSYDFGDLPQQLRNFVRADNLFFTAELETSNQPTVASPGKRKADGEEDWDMETQRHRSPPYDRAYDAAEELDPNPPGYYDEYEDPPSPYPPLSPPRSIARKPVGVGKPGSYDDTIPTSLRRVAPRNDPTSMIIDYDDLSDHGQEMRERGGGKSLLQSRNPYKLGSHTPRMDLDQPGDES
ncbi:hypothetical protein P7C71_g746, partial [Lecanoromycetidae sp. Uapishka_2]